MSWREIKTASKELFNSLNSDDEELVFKWNNFVLVCQQYSKENGFVTYQLENTLQKSSQKKDSMAILDHGCGAGLKCLYLMAIGYKRVYGVNVNASVERLNQIVNRCGFGPEQRFWQIDGAKLPFKSDFFDFIYSQQVLEHVKDEHIECFYKEENRVGKAGALIYHEVPHSFQPYDSHSRLFFAHWFPSFLQPFVYGLLKSLESSQNCFSKGKFYANFFNGDFLSLRSPLFHYQMARKYFGNVEDLTQERLHIQLQFSDYDPEGLSRLRRFFTNLFSLPIIGRSLSYVFKYAFMINTVSANYKTK